MASFKPNFSSGSLDSTGFQRLEFGTKDAHSEYVIPVIAFTFYDAKGDNPSANIYIRMTSSFETSTRSPFQETDGIFGQPGGDIKTITGALGALGSSGLEALTRQAINASGAAAGFLASAGASGKSQLEFLTRNVMNTFQQLIYRGPQFRSYQLPFTMRPTSESEAKSMRDIISTFKMASSARAGLFSPYSSILNSALKDSNGATLQVVDANKIGDIGNGQQGYEVLQGGNSLRVDLTNALSNETNFTFGYPNTCSFRVLLYYLDELQVLFESKLCVIEGVNVTYGSQNKLTFFDNVTGGNYYPSDVNLQITLKETVYHTHSDAYQDYQNAGHTIL